MPYNAKTTGSELVKELLPHINGKVVLVTGVTPNGLGAVFAETIALGQPALLILTARTPAKAEKVAEAITKTTDVRTKVLQLDLSSLTSVRKGAGILNNWAGLPHVDVLVNNAGIMAVEYKLLDGIESHFVTNHLGHFLFTNLIMNKILASSAPRIVNVSSDGHRVSPIRWDDYNFGQNGDTYNKWRAYGQSKTANMLFSISLAEKLGNKGLQSYSLHPGVIFNTNLGNHLDWSQDETTLRAVDREMGNKEGWAEFKVKSSDQGVATHVFASFDPNLKEHNGAYLEDSHVADPWVETVKPWATSSIEAAKLWKLSEKLVGQDFVY